MKKNLLKGSLFTIGASLWWGVIGVFYFKFVSFASPLELTIHRTIWTALLLIITTSYYSKWLEFKKLIKKPNLGPFSTPNTTSYINLNQSLKFSL